MDLSTYREADLCSSSSFKEKLFVSTIHKAKGLEFENVIILHCNTSRFPHFAHETFSEKEEDKRLFYVAISRAMKRLIVSTSPRPCVSPFLGEILHNFTVRKFIRNSFSKVLVECSFDKLRVIKRSPNKQLEAREYNIQNVFSSIKNQLELISLLQQQTYPCEVFEGVERIVIKYGGSLIK